MGLWRKTSGIIENINVWMARDFRSGGNFMLQPKSIILDVSTICQLNCSKCGMRIKNYGGLGAGYLRFSDFQKLIDSSPFIQNIELSNYGEVFLNPELYEIIEYAYKKNITLTMCNGVNFNDVKENVIDIMVRTGIVKKINFSIDGASQEVYVKYRRNGNFDKVIDNIRKLNAAKEKFGSEYPELSWQYILFEHNEDDVPKAIEMAKELGMEIFFKLDWDGSFKPKNEQRLKELTGLEIFNRSDYKDATGNTYLVNQICRQMIFQPVINFDGRLLGCCRVMSEDWGVNVFEEGVLTAINSIRYKEAIMALLDKDSVPDSDTPCGRCNQKRGNGECVEL